LRTFTLFPTIFLALSKLTLCAPYSPVHASAASENRPAVAARSSYVRHKTCTAPRPSASSSKSLSIPMPLSRENVSTIQIDIGTPSQTFDFLIDLGSLGFWVSAPCKVADCGNEARLEPNLSLSTSLVITGETFRLPALGTTLNITKANDTVKLGGMAIGDTEVGLGDLVLGDFNGFLGLGPPSQHHSVPPLLQTLVSKGVISTPTMSFVFSNGSHDGSGTIILGPADTSLFSNNTSVVIQGINSGRGEWALDVVPYMEGNLLSNASRKAVLSLGFPGIVVPVSVEELTPFFPNASLSDLDGTLIVPCNTTVSLTLSFQGNITLPLEPSDYLLGQSTGDLSLCSSNIVPDPTLEWRLGLPFHSKFFVSLDAEKETILLAEYAK